MSRAIYKYPLDFEVKHTSYSTRHLVTVEVPKHAKLLSIQVQDKYFDPSSLLAQSKICAWFEVDTEQGTVERTFELFGTGWDLPVMSKERRTYLSTVQMGAYVWHIYENERY